MNYTEEATLFACEGDTLVGILSRPELPEQTGVVVIVGGPQYRAGSHRQFVLLSRALAAAGYPVLRFDYRGMGDSTGTQRDFEAVSADIAAAIEALKQRVPAVRQVALWGLCDGASAALLYWHETSDPRISGLCLLNPWVRSEASLARTQVKHYYRQRLMQKEFWLKLMRGRVALGAVSGLIQKIQLANTTADKRASKTRQALFQHRMAAAWHGFNGHLLLLLSGDDYTAKEFVEYAGADPVWKNYQNHAGLLCREIDGADHTCSTPNASEMVETYTLAWLTGQSKGNQNGTP
ncbi:hydrolase 1, exosortase A system-associated [Rhodoferax sediminis]|uniref:Hydrolase 1, exosortase A system-associated n=1 Tax=Rhodoferax sediminis TaxID=2509614 RepID=A0A515D847_9BURK|nr:hydrolase 1, exosortase A system-associated [Rhodoferax sediminis]QDL36593.1 hydrolase 1, exosortase A system-associated [Rhodoferax sediminis]